MLFLLYRGVCITRFCHFRWTSPRTYLSANYIHGLSLKIFITRNYPDLQYIVAVSLFG